MVRGGRHHLRPSVGGTAPRYASRDDDNPSARWSLLVRYRRERRQYPLGSCVPRRTRTPHTWHLYLERVLRGGNVVPLVHVPIAVHLSSRVVSRILEPRRFAVLHRSCPAD